MKIKLETLIQPTIELAKAAGKAILEFYQQKNPLDIQFKADHSPLTAADVAAHKIISTGLLKIDPAIPILSEEDANINYATRKQWQNYWLVDPLDGTKEFIHHTHEFTVNIALIMGNHSELGVIYAPYYDLLYYGFTNAGAFKQIALQTPQQIHSRKKPAHEAIVVMSRRHSLNEAFSIIEKIPDVQTVKKGSSLKTCMIAEGLADIYPSLGPTSEWDMGAAQCIIEEAGGAMIDLQGNPLLFNTKESLLNPSLLVIGDKEYDWRQHLEA